MLALVRLTQRLASWPSVSALSLPCALCLAKGPTKSRGPQPHSSSTSMAHGMLVLPIPQGTPKGALAPLWGAHGTRAPNLLEVGPACPIPIPTPNNPDLCRGHDPSFLPSCPHNIPARWETETQRDKKNDIVNGRHVSSPVPGPPVSNLHHPRTQASAD